jgi:hypothetical protein
MCPIAVRMGPTTRCETTARGQICFCREQKNGLYNGLHLVWYLRVDLKPGANSVALGQGNTTPIDR